MEKQSSPKTQTSTPAQPEDQVQQTRGPELKEKMVQSQKEGEEFRASHSGVDQVKRPGSSNTEKSHKAEH